MNPAIIQPLWLQAQASSNELHLACEFRLSGYRQRPYGHETRPSPELYLQGVEELHALPRAAITAIFMPFLSKADGIDNAQFSEARMAERVLDQSGPVGPKRTIEIRQ